MIDGTDIKQESKLQLYGLVTSRPQSCHDVVQCGGHIYGAYAGGGKLFLFVS